MAITSHLFIVGAGFSFNAGLPLADEFTDALLNIKGLKLDGPSNRIVEYLRGFVNASFGGGAVIDSEDWPALEDIFTLVDLSANTGHHLGPTYSPAALRTVRRALIVRFIRMLQQKYSRCERSPDDNWNKLELLLKKLELDSSSVLSLNWDCVIEQGLTRTQDVNDFDYGCDAKPAAFIRDKIIVLKTKTSEKFQLLKPHGSINWLYCDACREVFWFKPNHIERVARTLFRDRDWNTVKDATRSFAKPSQTLNPRCPICGSYALGTRLATFSYRKALDFPMHAATWRRAEALLREAETWIFFGYSMPAADFEFKHLLKRVELSRKKKPHIVMITGGSGAKSTKIAYTKFFGPRRSASRTYFEKGLTKEVIKKLVDIGVLKKPLIVRKSP